MGYIKEPAGVDLYIKSKPLTKDEEKAISEFIKADKLKRSKVTYKRVKNPTKKIAVA
ncbi:MAG: hypothetical protein HY960_15470 [Ignavibacteriae bacterium]|nr:hypothetical protein [Ignavibacteriota bacterium]